MLWAYGRDVGALFSWGWRLFFLKMPVEIPFLMQYPHNINPVRCHLEKNDVGAGPDFFVPRPHVINVSGIARITGLVFHCLPEVSDIFLRLAHTPSSKGEIPDIVQVDFGLGS